MTKYANNTLGWTLYLVFLKKQQAQIRFVQIILRYAKVSSSCFVAAMIQDVHNNLNSGLT